MEDQFVIGVDLGGTKIAVAAGDSNGSILSKITKPTNPQQGVTFVVNSIISCINETINSAGLSSRNIKAIGLGVPGPINRESGSVIFAPNLMWHDVPIVHLLTRVIDVPVCLENDANIAALGEYQFGAGKGSENMIYITVSTGIGGAFILGGEIYLGSHGMAGEVGHMTIVDEGPFCGCGNQGCLEALAAGPAIAKRAQASILHGDETIMKDMVNGYINRITAEIVSDAALKGDIVAGEIITKAGEYLGIGISNLINIINPDTIVIGGGVTNVGELLFKPLRKTAERRGIKAAFNKVKIVRSKLQSDAGLIGAICLALK